MYVSHARNQICSYCISTITDILFFTGDQVNITWMYEDGMKHVGYIGLDWLSENCYNTSMSYSQRMKRNRPPVTVNYVIPCRKIWILLP